jgi:hypothetical protein
MVVSILNRPTIRHDFSMNLFLEEACCHSLSRSWRKWYKTVLALLMSLTSFWRGGGRDNKCGTIVVQG